MALPNQQQFGSPPLLLDVLKLFEGCNAIELARYK
jgi:hypothetical protein